MESGCKWCAEGNIRKRDPLFPNKWMHYDGFSAWTECTAQEVKGDPIRAKELLDFLDTEADKWAEEVNLPHCVQVILGDPVKIDALLRQSFIEGAYRGATNAEREVRAELTGLAPVLAGCITGPEVSEESGQSYAHATNSKWREVLTLHELLGSDHCVCGEPLTWPYYSNWLDHIGPLMEVAMCAAIDDAVAPLRKALEYYADDNNSVRDCMASGVCANVDHGKVARAALASPDGPTQ